MTDSKINLQPRTEPGPELFMTPLSRRPLFYLILIISLSILATSNVYSQQSSNKKSGKKADSSPIHITSDRMRSENGGQKIIFSGHVEAVRDDMTITSDIMEVYNTPDKKQTEEIVAIGNVEIVRCDKRAKGDRAVYLDQLQKIILTGTPNAVAWEGEDIIKGREMIFLIEKDRFMVNGRVRTKIFPKSDEKRKKKPSGKGGTPCSPKTK
jgi:lipopolysaccharide transport protein LptA